MTLTEIHESLKSRLYKSTNGQGQNFIFKFTEIHIFRDNEHIADYELKENNGFYYTELSNVKNGVTTSDFKNILLVADDKIEVLNFDKTDLQKRGRIEITLVAQ